MRASLRALAVLAFVEIAAFGVFSSRIGFYHDDWVVLEQLSSGGFADQVRALRWLAPRPLDIPLNQAFFAIGGLNPLPYHLLRLLLDLAAGWLFYLLLERLTGRRALALCAAALAMLVPNRDVLHFWFGISNESAATVAMFGALLCYWDWLEKRRAPALWAGLFLYMASVLTYEALAFFPLVLFAARAKNVSSAKREFRRFWPFGAVLAVALLWQRKGAALYAGIENNKTMGFSAAHALKVFGAGFECVSNRVVHIGALSLRSLWENHPFYFLPCALLAAAMTWPLLRDRDEKRGEAKPWLIAAALFFAAYLPYAATADYTPQIFGVMSRTNAGGAWACGLLLALLLSLAKKPYMKSALLGLLVLAFTATDWHRALAWGSSWDAQREIFAKLKAKDLPQGARVLLTGAPSDLDHAVVIEAEYAFDASLRLMTGRSDLHGNLLSLEKGPSPGSLVYDARTCVLSSRN